MMTTFFENNLPIFDKFILICKMPFLSNKTLHIEDAYETKQARLSRRACRK